MFLHKSLLWSLTGLTSVFSAGWTRVGEHLLLLLMDFQRAVHCRVNAALYSLGLVLCRCYDKLLEKLLCCHDASQNCQFTSQIKNDFKQKAALKTCNLRIFDLFFTSAKSSINGL